MKIVLGGSRFIGIVPSNVVELLDNWNRKGFEFLVGDAPGADLAFQKVLKSIGCTKVTVFSSAGFIRNNYGNWPSEKINSGLKSKSNAVHAFKDRHMTLTADFGLMLWDGKSAGTLSNVIDLVSTGKECKVWMETDSELYNFDNQSSLDSWLDLYPEVKAEAHKRLKIFSRRQSKRSSSKQQSLFD
jgi:hypothetical protein